MPAKSAKSAMDRLIDKLPMVPKNHVIHGLAHPDDMFAPPYDFERDGSITEWSTTPSPFRCRMRKNRLGDRAAFELELRPEKAGAILDRLHVFIHPVHIDARTGVPVEGFSLDTHYKYRKREMLAPVLVPVVVDLEYGGGGEAAHTLEQPTAPVKCQSVMVSVTMPREDGLYEIDQARFMWYFGQAAIVGPRPAHMPLYLQHQLREERNNTLRHRSLSHGSGPGFDPGSAPPDYASTSTVTTPTTRRDASTDRASGRSSSLGKKIIRATQMVFASPPGAGVPAHYTPEPYIEADPHAYDPYYSTHLLDHSQSTDSYASPASSSTPLRSDTKASTITGASFFST